MKIKQHLGVKNIFRYRMGYIRDGRDFLLPWKDNLILDTGLDMIGNIASYPNCFVAALFGNQVSPTPVARNSGAVTFTTTGSACVASGNFFVSSDVGRLIKFDDGGGQERYITAFADATHVTLGSAPSPAVVAQTATVWYVNETALESLYSSTTTYRTGSGDCGTSFSTDTRTMKRTYTGAVITGGGVTLTEIGFSNSGTNVNIFDRDIIVGGIALIDGDIPLCVAELIQTFTPSTPLSVGNVATGYDSSGTVQWCDIGREASFVNTVGATSNSPSFIDPINPTNTGQLGLVSGVFTLPAFNSFQAPASGFVGTDNETIAGYTPGSFFRDKLYSFNITSGNGTITGYQALAGGGSICWAQLLTTSFTKTGSQTLAITIRYSWQRILQN